MYVIHATSYYIDTRLTFLLHAIFQKNDRNPKYHEFLMKEQLVSLAI